MPFWGLLFPIVEFFGRMALKIGLAALEKKYPGIKPFLDQIIKWLGEQHAEGNTEAVNELRKHCEGPGCPMALVRE